MGIKERREREKLETRDRILDAARELFVRDGYEAVTMRKIAEQIEYSPTAIYHHFADKTALMIELCTLDFRVLAERIRKAADVADPTERVRRVGMEYLNFGLNNPNHYRLLFMTPKGIDVHPEPGPDGVQPPALNAGADAYTFLREVVRELMAAGCFHPGWTDVDLVAQLFWTSLHGVVSLHITMPTSAKIPMRPPEVTGAAMNSALMIGLQHPPSAWIPDYDPDAPLPTRRGFCG